MTSLNGEIPPEDFYGKKLKIQQDIEDIINEEHKTENELAAAKPKFMSDLLGPSLTWKVFPKQVEAIEFCLKRRNGLMAFAFEDVNGRRMFLVAHPKVFWSFNRHRFFKNCSTYEIIREGAASKLYLDIEYEYKGNEAHNQERMLDNLLKIINMNLNLMFNVLISKSDILELDSSSQKKFSRHIIYQIRNCAFYNNYAVGNFMKKLLDEIKEAHHNNSLGHHDQIRNLSQKYGMTAAEILEFFVTNDKNKVKLFVDEGVYTKNRHFRVLGSSKQSKNIPLVTSKRNAYKPEKSEDNEECSLFLDSLITWFSWPVTRVLSVDQPQPSARTRSAKEVTPTSGDATWTLHPQIDSFVNELIRPNGKIRRKIFFADTSTIVYEILGFRYCENIGRHHKSNNIKYVVDLNALGFYQKCFDAECADFRSAFKPLPDEIRFYFEDDAPFASVLGEPRFEYADEEFFLEAFDDSPKHEEDAAFRFHEDVSEEKLCRLVDFAEAVHDVEW